MTAGEEPPGVVQVAEGPIFKSPPEVVAHLRSGRPESAVAAADALNRYDVAIVQHEYGIYGGTDGDEILAVLDRVTVPVVAVLHTVLAYPTPHQRSVLERVIAAADGVVTMTETARQRLVRGYAVDGRKIVVIPHGAVARTPEEVYDQPDDRPTILTWGLLGPGKGIEWALLGLRELRNLTPLPRYVIAGQTHPRVRQQQGEAYRLRLITRAKALGVGHLIRFERQYLDDVALRRMIDSAAVVLLPNDSREQVTSGVLAEAIAAHKPVVSTAFPHAVELLSGGSGLLVPHANGPAIGAALRKVLTDPLLAARMSLAASRVAPGLYWPLVVDRYLALTHELL
jgi:glycosyltransferase involved in cell wall biosynthesis